MENMEYIKSLEDRIEKLEKFIAAIIIEGKNDISFNNCEIQGIALSKCRNVSVSCVNTENFGLAAFSVKMDSANIERFENKSQKTKIINSNVSDDNK